MPAGDPGGHGARRSADPGSIPIQMNWLSWLWPYLDELGDGIRRELGREPDDGDLLIALATPADSVAGRALRHSGIDLDRLSAVVRCLRTQTNEADLSRKAEKVRQQKEQALDAGDSQTADQLREEERRLTMESRQAHRHAVDEIRRRLALHRQLKGPA